MQDFHPASVVAGACILLVIAMLPVRSHAGGKYAWLGFISAALAIIGLVNLGLHLGDFVVDGDDERILKAQVDHVAADAAAGHVPKNLLVIEGSSQTALGLDTSRVEQALRGLGYDVSVVDLSIPGGNILERYTLEQRFVAEMHAHQLAYSPNTRLLFELNPNYDKDPLWHFAGNQETLKAYYYSDFGNLAFASRIYAGDVDGLDRETLITFGDFVSHSVVWELKLGFLPEMQRFDSLPEESAFTSFDIPDHTGSFRRYDPTAIRAAGAPPDLPQLADMAHRQADRALGLYGASASGYGYFFVAARSRKDMLYGHAFCQQATSVPCIDPSDPAIYTALDQAEDYFNRDHLSRAGAHIYSDWFAQQLIAQGLVIR